MKALRGIVVLISVAMMGLLGCSEAMGPDSSGPTNAESATQALPGNGNGPPPSARPPGEGVHQATSFDGETISYRVVGDGWRDIILVHAGASTGRSSICSSTSSRPRGIESSFRTCAARATRPSPPPATPSRITRETSSPWPTTRHRVASWSSATAWGARSHRRSRPCSRAESRG